MKRPSYLPGLFVVFISSFLTAQQDQGIALQKEYTVEELSYGKIPEATSASLVSPIDLVEAQPSRVHFRTSEKIYFNGHHVFQTTLLNAEEVFSNWPAKPSNIVSDSSGISMYDATGALWNYTPADSNYLAAYNETRLDFIDILNTLPPVFPMPDSALFAYLDSAGYVIQLLEGEAIKISNAEEEVLYEPQILQISTKKYEEGRLASERQLRYTTVGGYGVAPEVEREIRYEIRPSGMCMEKILARRYSGYSIQLTERSNPAGPACNKKDVTRLTVWPNPVADAMFVQLPDNILAGGAARILNAAGVLVLERSGIQPGATLNLQLRHLPPGVYHLQAELQSGLLTQKIIKQ